MLASETDKHWRRGYVSGTFDMFHIGHLNLIRRAKERCDYLIVGVLADDVVMQNKKKWPVIPQHERLEITGALKYVDEVDITTEPLIDKVAAWEKYRFDAMFSGDDHRDNDWLKANEKDGLDGRGVDVVFFPYTKEVTTTLLQDLTLPPKADHASITEAVEVFRRVFPFDKVEKGERIVIYGAGRVGAQFASQLNALSYCEVVAFADTNAKKGDTFAGKRNLTPEELKSSSDSFDRIVIATALYRDEMLSILRNLGFGPERIV
jgi:glycerol-3-phosphate cytidylyltransferase